MNYHLLALVNALLTVLVISVLAMLMHKFVEKPGIRMANGVVKLLESEDSGVTDMEISAGRDEKEQNDQKIK